MENKKNKFLEQAEKELGYLSDDPDFKRLIEARAGFLKDERAFELAGMKKGRKEAKEEIAKELLKMNLTVEQIIKATGLTKKEIERLDN